ncbi:MAG: hypothetical protein Q7R33_03565, partial [Nitrosarchaeum sp.]|nr:hypothetical protein [Nitrosarchaeum sp.]
MKKQLFDDQHQPMSNWLDNLASQEASSFTSTELKDDTVGTKKTAAYKGASSTWAPESKLMSSQITSDSSRQVENKPKIKIASSIAEKEARKLLMTGVSLEKMSSIIKRQYNTNLDVSKFENEFGKLGYIYIDASLVDTCDDLSTILKSSNRVANVGVKFVKTTAKCASCIYNKRSECVKLGLTIADKPAIKTVAEAKNILNKFAALKYVNSFFVKAADLTTYYTRLANEDPQKVVTDFLTDVDNRR